MKMMAQKAEVEKTNNKRDGAKLSFKEKMELFAAENGDNEALREKSKISNAQREINDPSYSPNGEEEEEEEDEEFLNNGESST
jgi:hypothetical protein